MSYHPGMTAETANASDLASYLREHALRFGTFTLASGATSTYYIDVRRASLSGRGAVLIADGILDLLEREGMTPDAIGGMDMGATPIAAAVGLRAHPMVAIEHIYACHAFS